MFRRRSLIPQSKPIENIIRFEKFSELPSENQYLFLKAFDICKGIDEDCDVFAFGSRTTTRYNSKSDIDIVVLTTEEKWLHLHQIFSVIFVEGLRVDIKKIITTKSIHINGID